MTDKHTYSTISRRMVSLFLAVLISLVLCMCVYADEVYVDEVPKDIVIDGNISTEEWGEPVYSCTPENVIARINDGWDYRKNTGKIPENQHIEIYVTNDADYIYVGCRVVNAEKDFSCTNISDISNKPHFIFTVTQYDEKTVVPRIIYQQATYDQYSHYCLGFVNGQKAQQCKSQGMAINNLGDSQYEIIYDDGSRTYTYECMVPLKYTNISLNTDNRVVMGFDICDASINGAANRYFLSRAAEAAQSGGGAWYYAGSKSNPFIIHLLKTDKLVTKEFIPAADEEQKSGKDRMTVDNWMNVFTDSQTPVYVKILTAVATAAVLAAIAAIAVTAAKNSRNKKRGKEEKE